nr:MAG TPA: hypothetical protein [Caudoviricetes sp.]
MVFPAAGVVVGFVVVSARGAPQKSVNVVYPQGERTRWLIKVK